MNLCGFKDIAAIAEALATVAAILVGGFWSYTLFVRKRQRYPRANVKHRVTHRSIPNEKLLVSVAVTISNAGDVLLSLVSAETRIQKVLPLPPQIVDCINKGNDPVPEGQREIDWPLIASRKSTWERREAEIEPGESDHFSYDFIVDGDTQTIEVYSYFKNAKKRDREIGWGLTTVYDLRSR